MSQPRLPAIALFCRTPIAGRVKTRLQPPLSTHQALALHVACIQDVCSHLSLLRPDFDVFIFQSEPGELPKACDVFPRRMQQGFDLGERMLQAVNSLLADQHPAVLLLGTDLPHLNTVILYQSLEWLKQSDVVIGPASDGGYYLLALRGLLRFLFEDMAWGTNRVLADTLGRLNQRQIRHHLLDEAFDLDRPEDLHRLLHSADAVRAPHTLEFIRRIAPLLKG